jgi:hypothetical protein
MASAAAPSGEAAASGPKPAFFEERFSQSADRLIMREPLAGSWPFLGETSPDPAFFRASVQGRISIYEFGIFLEEGGILFSLCWPDRRDPRDAPHIKEVWVWPYKPT